MDNKGLENVLPQTEDEVAEMALMYAALIRATHEDVVENVMLRAQIAESERQRAAAVEDIKHPSVCERCVRHGFTVDTAHGAIAIHPTDI